VGEGAGGVGPTRVDAQQYPKVDQWLITFENWNIRHPSVGDEHDGAADAPAQRTHRNLGDIHAAESSQSCATGSANGYRRQAHVLGNPTIAHHYPVRLASYQVELLTWPGRDPVAPVSAGWPKA